MTEDNTMESSAEAKRPPKKPYVKPSFRREKIFETQALICGKVSANIAPCRFNRKNS